MSELFGSIEEYASAFREQNEGWDAYGDDVVYSTAAFVDPSVSSRVKGSPEPRYKSSLDLISAFRDANPDRLGASTDEEVAEAVAQSHPSLAAAWSFGDAARAEEAPAEEEPEDPFSKAFPNWIGPKPEDLSKFKNGKIVGALMNKNLEGKPGFAEGLKGDNGIRD